LGLVRSSPAAGHGSRASGWFGPWLRAWDRFEVARWLRVALKLGDPALQRVEATQDRGHPVRFLLAGFQLELCLQAVLAGFRDVGVSPAADCLFGDLPLLDLFEEVHIALPNRCSLGLGLGRLQLNFLESEASFDETIDGESALFIISPL